MMKSVTPLLAISVITILSSCGPVIIPPPLPHAPHKHRAGLAVLPYGYRTIHVGGARYYYNGRYWYQRRHGRYYSCARPRGYKAVPTPPRPPHPPRLPKLPHQRW